jgi:hypothetical protein
MTDTSLPSHQSPVPVQSYVDSYTPPAAGVSASAAPVSSSPSNSTPQAASPKTDPLAELEKALEEYEAKQKELSEETEAIIKKAEKVTQESPKEDPLAELERVLDEYEARYKTELAAEQKATAPSAAPAAPVSPSPAVSADTAAGAPRPSSSLAEPIEEQNIFELLGVTDAAEAEKEAFLDELQQALWDDFLDKDLQLLVDDKQLAEMNEIKNKAGLSEVQRQEELIQKVEAWVPDVEEIMLEKALQLKEDMVRERVQGMKEYFKDRSAEMAKIQEAENHIRDGRWKTAATLLNSLAG